MPKTFKKSDKFSRHRQIKSPQRTQHNMSHSVSFGRKEHEDIEKLILTTHKLILTACLF